MSFQLHGPTTLRCGDCNGSGKCPACAGRGWRKEIAGQPRCLECAAQQTVVTLDLGATHIDQGNGACRSCGGTGDAATEGNR